MERGSDKHSSRLDDELARQARAYTQGRSPGADRADESLEQEPPGEDQPEPTLIPEGDRPGGAPAPLSAQELEARSELGKAVPRSALPGRRDDLLRGAREQGAEERQIAQLASLPADRTFHTVYEIWEALGGRNEQV